MAAVRGPAAVGALALSFGALLGAICAGAEDVNAAPTSVGLLKVNNEQASLRATSLANSTQELSSAAAADGAQHVEDGGSQRSANPLLARAALLLGPWVPLWLQGMTLTGLIKGLCVASNLLCQASPCRDIWQVHLRGHTGSLNPLPFISMAFCSAQWSFYAVFAELVTGNRGFLTIVYANVCGLVLGAFYTWVYQRNCQSEGMWRSMRLYFAVFCTAGMMEAITLVSLPVKSALYFAGLCAAILSVAVGFAPFASIHQVFETHRLDSLPLDMILVGSVSTVLWLTCGILINDKWIFYTNAWALVNNTVLLGIIARFHPRTAKLFLKRDVGKGLADAEVAGFFEAAWKAEATPGVPRVPREDTPLSASLGRKACGFFPGGVAGTGGTGGTD